MLSKAARWTFADSKNSMYFSALMTLVVALILGRWSWWILITFVVALALTMFIGQIWFLEEITKEILGYPRPSFKSFFQLSKAQMACYLSSILLITPVIIIFHLSPFQACLITGGYVAHFLMIHHNFFEKKPEETC